MFEPMMRVCHEPGIMINLNCASDIQKRKQSRINKGGGTELLKERLQVPLVRGVVLIISFKNHTET